MGKKWISLKGNLFFSIFFEINEKKISYKQFTKLNAYIIRGFYQNIFQKKLILNGQTIY